MSDPTNIDALRARLDGTRGREYWRSLESLAETPEFKEFLHREFPQNASEWLDPVGRRNFLKLMGASLALAGVSACTRQPNEELVPYVRQPEELVPGKPLFFATAMPMNGAGIGLLVESHEGRPTKIEGNPDHPSSRGATDVFAQAAILGLYDPDRSQTLTNLGDMGVQRVYGIIYPPQVALIGFGKIGLRPWVSDGALAPRHIVTATLAADHRTSDGLVGAQFLSALDRILQEPERLESAS